MPTGEIDATARRRTRALRLAQMYGSKLLLNPCVKCGEIKYYHDNLTHPFFKNNLDMLEFYSKKKEEMAA